MIRTAECVLGFEGLFRTDSLSQLYKTVVDDVITNVKEAFLDEGVDEQVLQELRHLWENKLQASKALDPVSERPEGQMATPAMGILLQQQSQSQQLQQGYIPRGAVLTTTTQQPQQTTFPVSISANQAGELQAQGGIIQLDGAGDTSSSEEEDFDNDDNDDDNDEEQNEDEGEQGEEEEPLNSADDVSEEDPTELFDAENVVVCQYDKINRNKNKWKFHLKDGIMNLNGRDYVFQKANGDAEW
nr:hypothetical protein BaRGS_008226 [Batillaria attramentaria]